MQISTDHTKNHIMPAPVFLHGMNDNEPLADSRHALELAALTRAQWGKRAHAVNSVLRLADDIGQRIRDGVVRAGMVYMNRTLDFGTRDVTAIVTAAGVAHLGALEDVIDDLLQGGQYAEAEYIMSQLRKVEQRKAEEKKAHQRDSTKDKGRV